MFILSIFSVIHFNPQGPRGPRHCAGCKARELNHFNPQGPRGPRRMQQHFLYCLLNFNPQGPRGPRPQPEVIGSYPAFISIHKALAGLDAHGGTGARPGEDFNPQGPRGPRHILGTEYQIQKKFQSTRPSRASTAIFTNFFQFFFIFLFIMLHFSHSTFLSHPKIPIFYTTFPAFSSANIQAFPCPIHIRTKKSTVLLHQIQALLLYAPPYFYIGSPDNKISGCLYLYQ